MPRSACHEIRGVLIEGSYFSDLWRYGKANALASQCGGEHAVL
jgi:hypothetical protein